jgi:hypothetical protein
LNGGLSIVDEGGRVGRRAGDGLQSQYTKEYNDGVGGLAAAPMI